MRIAVAAAQSRAVVMLVETLLLQSWRATCASRHASATACSWHQPVGSPFGQFCRSAGRRGAMQCGMHASMPLGTLACTMPASMGQITSFSKKKPTFFGNQSKFEGKQQPRPRQPPWARSQGQGSPPCACCQGQGSPHGHPLVGLTSTCKEHQNYFKNFYFRFPLRYQTLYLNFGLVLFYF